MKYTMKKHMLAAGVAASATLAAAQPGTEIERRLIGSWQQINAKGVPEQVITFKPNHTFVMSAKCGRQAEEMKKAGLSVFSGNWQIVSNKILRLEVAHKGSPASFDSSISIAGREAKLTNAKGITNSMYRYEGRFPQVCPEGLQPDRQTR